MPNRLIREGLLDSDAVGEIDIGAEVLFVRLMLLADDFGRYDGRVTVVCRRAFVNRRNIDEETTGQWLQQLVDTGLIDLYEVGGKPYIEIHNFKQRTRSQISKYPNRDGLFEVTSTKNQQLRSKDVRHMSDMCQTDDGHMSDVCLTDVGHRRTETETETEYPLTPTGGHPVASPPSPSAAPPPQAFEDEKHASDEPDEPEQPKRSRAAKGPVSMRSWLAECAAKGEKPIPEGDASLRYAASVGLPDDFVALHWAEFKARGLEADRRYKSWRKAFTNSLRGNWYRLWRVNADGSVVLTTNGEQARRAQVALAKARGQTQEAAVPVSQ